MKTTMTMLTPDRVGLTLAALGLASSSFMPLPLSLVGLGVFGPPLLRELGWLRDDDDYTRQASHRAGFHAALMTVFLLLVQEAALLQSLTVTMKLSTGEILSQMILLILTAVSTYAISFAVQYWGARIGVSRVFWGVAGFILLKAAEGFLISRIAWDGAGADHLIFYLGIAFAAAVMAVTIGRKPRLGAVILIGLMLVQVWFTIMLVIGATSVAENLDRAGVIWMSMGGFIWVALLCGALGVALLREKESD